MTLGCITDAFGRADSLNDLGDTEDPVYPWIGYSEGEEGNPIWRIYGNKLYWAINYPGGSAPGINLDFIQALALVDHDMPSPNMRVTVGAMEHGAFVGEVGTGNIGPAGRITDQSNYWYVYIPSIDSGVANFVELHKVESGVDTEPAYAADVPFALGTDTLALEFSGDTINVYVSDVLQFTYSDSFNNTALRAGVAGPNSGDVWDTAIGTFEACTAGAPPLAGTKLFVAGV